MKMTQQTINTTGGVTGQGDSAVTGAGKINANFTELYASNLDVVIVVKDASDFGTIDSSKLYYLDGVIDMGSTSITVPAAGISISGGNFNVSKLTSSDANYTMFVSDAGGSGDVFLSNIGIEVTGTSSKVFNLTDIDGFHAIEMNVLNFNNCTSLGTISSYRQGLEFDTGRFGGKPELTLAGTWLGGYTITTSIVRSLAAGSYFLYKAGASFLMNSRFRTNQNIDLPASVGLVDFAESNFANPSTLQLEGVIITRNGTSNADDALYTPNITMSSLSSNWRDNVGLPNTFVGGRLSLSSAIATTISIISTYYDVAGTFTSSDLEHFDVPSNGQLRHLGNNPREYNLIADLVFTGTANDLLRVKFVKWDNSASGFVDISTQLRRVNSTAGAADSAFFTLFFPLVLDINDYVKLQISNTSGARNATLTVDSFFTLQER
jgi:hypothetical protein